MQVDRQCAASAQAKPLHVATGAVAQPPVPSHVLLVSFASPQVVPQSFETLGYVHALVPVPSHVPLHGSLPLHGVRAPCGSPTTGAHVPLLAPSHASHWPLQAALQQKPSTQNVLVHSFAAPHASPVACLNTQVPAAPQYASSEQSASPAHVVLQASLPQPYGAQGFAAVVRHEPAPLQVRPLTLPSAHVVAPHLVVSLAYTRHAPEPSHEPSALQLAG